MHARRCQPQHGVAGLDVMSRQQAAAFGSADREAREIIVADLVEPRHLGGLAADESAASLLAAGSDPGYHGSADFRRKLAGGEIVEKEQRLGPLDYEIVDRHGDEIDADGVVPPSLDGDLDFCA